MGVKFCEWLLRLAAVIEGSGVDHLAVEKGVWLISFDNRPQHFPRCVVTIYYRRFGDRKVEGIVGNGYAGCFTDAAKASVNNLRVNMQNFVDGLNEHIEIDTEVYDLTNSTVPDAGITRGE